MSEWQPIETAPKMRNILLFVVTDRREDGSVSNWKMESGQTFGRMATRIGSGLRELLDPWETPPTHWMELHGPPK